MKKQDRTLTIQEAASMILAHSYKRNYFTSTGRAQQKQPSHSTMDQYCGKGELSFEKNKSSYPFLQELIARKLSLQPTVSLDRLNKLDESNEIRTGKEKDESRLQAQDKTLLMPIVATTTTHLDISK